VHAAETSMFLAAYRRFGTLPLSDHDADVYVNEMAALARDLGVENPPTNVAELDETIERFRPELRLCPDAVTARDFVAKGVVKGLQQHLAYWLFVQSSFALLTRWERDLLGVKSRLLTSSLLIQPATSALCALLRVFVPPTQRIR
jgi:uncharacterized protein (DUF2236 family)